MPHCTLTGFFHDCPDAIALYNHAIESTLKTSNTIAPKQRPIISITQLLFEDHWHGLVVDSLWLKNFTQAFAANANSPSRQEELRLKDWLHVSLAYEFEPHHHATLKQLALELVDPNAAVAWELRFYQRSPQNEWTLHGSWAVPT